MDDRTVFISIIISIAAFMLGRLSMLPRLKQLLNRCRSSEYSASINLNLYAEIKDENAELNRQINDQESTVRAFRILTNEVLRKWRSQSVSFPLLLDWEERVQRDLDQHIEKALRNKKRPAKKSADEVRDARRLSRERKAEFTKMQSLLRLYESLAPWLAEYSDASLNDILEGLETTAKIHEYQKSGHDPVKIFVPKTEWRTLSERDRNQLALDRYWQNRKQQSSWHAGIQYERYIGYRYEKNGFRVVYYGAERGVEDLGIDLICRKNGKTFIIQCKRLSKIKKIPVRENIIAQIYGATQFYKLEHEIDSETIPVIYTTYRCSSKAKKFAKHLGVTIYEDIQMEEYPCIKCNISRQDGQKIYHLPFDQQYDSTIIGDNPEDFYAATVAEAEQAGFRRAYKWSGNTSN